MVDMTLSQATYQTLREQAEDALTGPAATPKTIRAKQKELAKAGLYPESWIDGDAGEITLHAARIQADPYYARSYLEDVLVSPEEWTATDIRKTQITLSSLDLYDGDITGTMDETTGNALLDYFPQSLTIANGRIGATALTEIVNSAEDMKIVQALKSEPYLDSSRSSYLLSKDEIVGTAREAWKLTQAFGAAEGLSSRHNIDGILGPETAAAVLTYEADNQGIISGVLQREGKLGYQDIRNLQRSLSTLGYNIGFADASMGPQTATGIMNYLSDNPDQIAAISDDNLKVLLKYGNHSDLAALMESSPEFLHKLEEDLLHLDEGGPREILSAQIRLQALGLYDRGLDGLKGAGTEVAIAGFHTGMQSDYTLTAAEPGILTRKHSAENPIATVAPSNVQTAALDVIPGSQVWEFAALAP